MLAIEELLFDATARGIMVIAVTHDVGHARRLAQHIVFLHHCRVLAHQPAAQFFASPASEAARAFREGELAL